MTYQNSHPPFCSLYSLYQRSILSFLMLTVVGCGGTQLPSPMTYKNVSKTIEYYKGDIDLSALTPTSRFKETFAQSSLGRTIELAKDQSTKNTLSGASPCSGLLPDRIRDDYRDRLEQVFDNYVLTRLSSNEESIRFPATNFMTSVETQAKPNLFASGYVGISRILSYVNDKELKHYDHCCTLTGSCGKLMVNKLYEVTRDIRYMSRLQPTLVASLLAFEQRSKGDYSPNRLQGLAKQVYQDQAKYIPQKPTLDISHIAYRKIPTGVASPFDKAHLEVSASDKIRCKPKKSKTASVVEFMIRLKSVEGAQEALGFEITTSKQWIDLSLAERNRLVKVGTGSLACYPGPDAFTNPDDRCPAEIILTAFPPSCTTMKDNGDFKWNAKVGIYAPGDRERQVHHQQKTNTVATKVHKR